jgi:hypothetical protein
MDTCPLESFKLGHEKLVCDRYWRAAPAGFCLLPSRTQLFGSARNPPGGGKESQDGPVELRRNLLRLRHVAAVFPAQLLSLLIATVSLAGFHFGFGLMFHVLTQRAFLIVRLLKLSSGITANITFIAARIDQLAFASIALLWHVTLLDLV